ncbi:MAG: hypothetical protein AB7H92_18635 [Microbacteriaceae bacterium]
MNGTATAPAKPVVVRNRFINASAEHTEPFYDSGQVAAGTQLNNIEIPAYGYFSGILVQVDVTSSGNSATVALAQDGPFNILSNVNLTDVNGANLYGPMTGFDAFLAAKYGGYDWSSDPRQKAYYAQSATGSGGTAGTESFLFRIPVQINPRDAYGALPNMNAASTFKLNLTINSLAGAFATPPNGTVTVRVRCTLEALMLPAAADAFGNPNEQAPPGVGSYQRWVKNTFTVNNGANTFRLPNVGNLIRTLILVFRNATPARIDTTFMDPIQQNIDGLSVLLEARAIAIEYVQERYGYVGTIDAAGGRDTGVFVFDYSHELDGKPGFETRELYLRTNQATRLEYTGTTSAAGTLDVLTNDVIPVGQVVAV